MKFPTRVLINWYWLYTLAQFRKLFTGQIAQFQHNYHYVYCYQCYQYSYE